MANPPSSPNDASPLDLTELDFGPRWAKNIPEKNSSSPRQESLTSHHSKRFAKNPRKGYPSGHNRSQNPRPPRVPPTEGVSLHLMPVESGMNALAKHLSDIGRTHSIFSLAQSILKNRERFYLVFESSKSPLFFCKKQPALWISEAECLSFFWQASLWQDFYEEVHEEGEAPKGSFESVAYCSISHTLIAPPNHHSYAQRLAETHAMHAAHLSLEDYKKSIKLLHDEEQVNNWKQQAARLTFWKIKSTHSKEGEKEILDDSPSLLFKDKNALEQHFQSHFFKKVFSSQQRANLPSDIPSKHLSQGLVTLLANYLRERKKASIAFIPVLCRQLTGRHLAVFKWKKSLYCGPSRPKKIQDPSVMAELPTRLFNWVNQHPGGSLDELWAAILPPEITKEDKQKYFHDLHWLINEGFVLLFADGSLHTTKEQQKEKKLPLDKKGKTSPKPEDSTSSSPLSDS